MDEDDCFQTPTGERESERGGGHSQRVGSGRSPVVGGRCRSLRTFWDITLSWTSRRDMFDFQAGDGMILESILGFLKMWKHLSVNE